MADPLLRLALHEAAAALARGDAANAEAAARRALAVDAADADALNLLGLARFKGGDRAGAIAALQAAVAARPGYRNAWDNLVAMRDADGRPADGARAAARAVDAAPPATPDRLCAAGGRAFAAGLLPLAASLVERAHAADPSHRRALHHLAVVRDAQRRPQEARLLIERALAAPGADATERAAFAAIWSKATAAADLSRALAEALRVLEADPGHPGARDCAAIVLGKLGRRADAVAMARAALRIAPAHADVRYTLARLLEEDGALAEAAAVLAAPEAPADARLARLAGTLHLRCGEPGAAVEALARALQLAPEDQSAIAQRGLALALVGRTAAARDWLGTARFVARVRLVAPPGFADATAFNRALAHDIRHHSRLRFEPLGLAARGGFLTEDLMADRTPAIVGFEQALRTAIEAYVAALPDDPEHPFLRAVPRGAYGLNLWATRVAEQGVIDTHIHEESWLSGAYYVELPPAVREDATAGWIEFGRPHRGLPEPAPDDITCQRPEVGTLLLFPSYLYHRTLPFAGAGERISISFDLAPSAVDPMGEQRSRPHRPR
ncbi:MAG: putative 2OG-Fe(II) oxygenase [Pseudomonadota bacterium]